MIGPEETLTARPCSRTYQLEDMTVRADGSGRVVESYFAVFAPARAEVMDQDGHYFEENAPTLFTKTLAERGLKIPVFYNHARTLDGTPAGELSVPIGVPVEIRTDDRGVFNAVRYLDNPLADSVLEGIRSRAISGMSYSGRFIKSRKQWPDGRSRGALPVITRMEAAIREFGPTAIPAFPQAEILGSRAQQVLRMLLTPALADDAGAASFLSQFEGLATPTEGSEPDEAEEGTPNLGAAETEEPRTEHSARSSVPLCTRIRAARIAHGI